VKDLISTFFASKDKVDEDVDIVDRAAGLPEQAVLNIFVSILNSLKYFAQEKLCHGDIKPSNLLLDQSGKAVLIDLGAVVPYGAAIEVYVY
jgi:serine/threonine protein kinase